MSPHGGDINRWMSKLSLEELKQQEEMAKVALFKLGVTFNSPFAQIK